MDPTTKPITIRLRFKHGLGDAVQFQIVLWHLRHYYPNARITIETKANREGVFEHLVDCVSPLIYPWNTWAATITKYVTFGKSNIEFAEGLPPSKVTKCLIDEFGLQPLPPLFFYSCCIGDKAQQEVDDWYATLPRPIVCFHYEGESCPDKKNIDKATAKAIAEGLNGLGATVVVLDWGLNKIVNGTTIVQPPKSLKQESERLAALIDTADGFVGIDSGPGHLAAATDTPGVIVWTGHHPTKYFDDPNPTLTHLVGPAAVDDCDGEEVQKWFEATFNHRYLGHSDLAATVVAMMGDKLKEPVNRTPRFTDTDEMVKHFPPLVVEQIDEETLAVGYAE